MRHRQQVGRFTLGALIALMLPGFPSGKVEAQSLMTAKPAVVRGNFWHLRNSLTTGVGETSFQYGKTGDIPIMGDWNGDGTATPGVVRGNNWFLRNSNTTGFADVAFTYGSVGDIPIVGDWDGDGDDTPGVVRKRPGSCDGDVCVGPMNDWHLRNENSTGFGDVSIEGYGGGVPLTGDWDNDSVDTLADRSGNSWFINNELDSTVDFVFQYGIKTDLAIRGDWDGDGVDSAGVVRGNVWHLRNALTTGVGEISFQYGSPGDTFLVWH